MPLTGPDSPVPGGLTPAEEDEKLLEAVAERVVRMGMAVPAIFFLESTKPLSYIGSQALVFLEPFVKSFLNLASYDRFVALLEDRQNIEKLLRKIEDRDEASREREKERKREERDRRTAARAAGGTMAAPRARGSLWSRLKGSKGRRGR
jgi:hypothetical protein